MRVHTAPYVAGNSFFVTIRTHHRHRFFGDIEYGALKMNDVAEVVRET